MIISYVPNKDLHNWNIECLEVKVDSTQHLTLKEATSKKADPLAACCLRSLYEQFHWTHEVKCQWRKVIWGCVSQLIHSLQIQL